jgi:hypothetical protein
MVEFCFNLHTFYIKIVEKYIKSAITYKYQFKEQLRSKTKHCNLVFEKVQNLNMFEFLHEINGDYHTL